MCIQVDQLDAQILIMCLYLSLSALHVSDSLVHHQERRFGAVYRKWYKPVRLAVVHNSEKIVSVIDRCMTEIRFCYRHYTLN